MLDRNIGERIRELRELQHYTREALAEKVDISSKFLYEIETRGKGFSAETLGRLAHELSISCDYILFGEETEHRGSEKIICILELMNPKQRSRMRELVKIMMEMCEGL